MPDPYKSQNAGALEAQNGGVEAQNGALEDLFRPVVADSHDFDQEPDRVQHLSLIWIPI